MKKPLKKGLAQFATTTLTPTESKAIKGGGDGDSEEIVVVDIIMI